jgi:hypothetical protein
MEPGNKRWFNTDPGFDNKRKLLLAVSLMIENNFKNRAMI